MSPILLAIDTSTEACSVALSTPHGVFQRYEFAPRLHGERVLPMVREVLDEARLPLSAIEALVIGRGPGAFTGLRIAAGVVQGLAWGLAKPVVSVSTLAAMARRARREQNSQRVLALIDARMGEVYSGLFRVEEDGDVIAETDERVWSPDALLASGWLNGGDPIDAVGSGCGVFSPSQPDFQAGVRRQWPDCFPHAYDMLALGLRAYARGETLTAAEVCPVYLRDDVVQVKRPRVPSEGPALG